ncbi:MAG: hypothetical protein IJY10_04415 [Lachnospiraceae bacterium]|nr:hypothetical protein [Lachnospiraceae bacterium]
MNAKYIKALAVVVIIVSILIFLWNSFFLYVAGFVRECDRIKINDSNRQQIVSLIKETMISLLEEKKYSLEYIEYYEKMPNLNQAIEIERFKRFRDVEITVYYEDGTRYYINLDNSEDNRLCLLIRSEGYNVYFRSLEFAQDLIKILIPVLLIVISVVVIRKY